MKNEQKQKQTALEYARASQESENLKFETEAQGPQVEEINKEDITSTLGTTMINVTNGENVVATQLQRLDITKDLISTDSGQKKTAEDFLAVPRIISRGTLDPNDSLIKANYLVPYDMLALGNNILAAKLKGFMGLRGDMVFKLQVNASPFVQGRIRLCFLYTAGLAYFPPISSAGNAIKNWFNMHIYGKTQASQLPGVDMDISCQTEVTLKVPFVSSEPTYPLANFFTGTAGVPGEGPGNVGYIIIYTYSPVNGGTSFIKPKYTLWSSFENAQLLGPTIAQMNDLELDSKTGPISGPAKTISTIAGTLAKFPHLSSYAAPVKWASDIVGGVAKTLGYSRPTNEAPVARMKRMLTAPLSHTDVVDTSVKMSFSNEYNLESVPGFAGNDIDELSFKYLYSIWSYLGEASWSTSNNSGDILLARTVTPYNYVTDTIDTNTIYSFAPFTLIVSRFGLWRGTIEYRFKIVKTSFHSGRLMFRYRPRDNRFSEPSPDFVDTMDGQNIIVDIREGAVVEIKCPFISTVPWNETDLVGTNNLIDIVVLDPLQCPDTVAGTIKILVEHRAGDDFCVGGDYPPYSYVPYVPSAAQSGMRPDCEIVSETLGGTINMSNMYSRALIGNQILSFRSLVKKPARCNDKFLTYSADVYMTFQPWMCEFANKDHKTPDDFSNWEDALTLVTSCYALSRGSAGVKIIPFPAVDGYNKSNGSDFFTSQVPMYWEAVCNGYDTGKFYDTLNNTFHQSSKPTMMGNLAIGDVPEVLVPAPNRFVSRVNAELDSNTNIVVGSNYGHKPRMSVSFRLRGSAALTTERVIVYRFAGDDFEAGCFVSVPPMYAL